jgi:hypothetical protein
MKQCSIQGYEALVASPLSDALLDGLVFLGCEVWGVGNVGETHLDGGEDEMLI